MIGFKGFFKTPSHRIFDYKPMYYDEEEEVIQRQLKKKKFLDGLSEEDIEKEYHKEKLRLSLRKKREQVMTVSKGRSFGSDARSNFRVVAIVLILIAISYFILK